MIQRLLSRLTPIQKNKLRSWYKTGKEYLVRRFFSYSPAELKNHLHQLGIAPGDTLLVHSAYGPLLGFQGSPNALLDTFLEIVGADGNLMMVSIPYFSATSDYLSEGRVFDVRKTPSKMGLISETFRRRPGVIRSIHPTHPVLAFGPRADWIVAGHENCAYPCGPVSPFEKLLELNGKVLFFGVTEFHFTFHHYLEDLVKEDLPFPLYEDQPYVVKVIAGQDDVRWVKTYAFTKEAISRRRVKILFDELERRGQLKRSRIGNTRMVLMATPDTVACTKDLARKGIYFYDMGVMNKNA